MSPMMFPFLTGMVPPLVKEKLGPESLRPELISDPNPMIEEERRPPMRPELPMGGIGMLQARQIGPLNRLGQYINQELAEENQGEVQEFIGEVGDMANQRFGVDLGSAGQRPMFNQLARPAVQMYEKGGAAFPDLSGDGKITQKDILIGRGVIEKEYGGPVGMQMGGDPMMAAGMPPPQAPPMPAPEQAPQDQLDPNIVQSALAQAAGGIGDLDQAQNYEQVMNTMRGDQATVEERREELAEVVGPGDANQTPESVLTLVQPVMMLANVDQCIGQLAQQEMTQPMEGPMAGGIMSTVPEPPMMEAGGTAPVNFNKGGEVRPVQYFQNAGLVSGDVNPFANLSGRLGPLAQQAYEARRSLLGTPEDVEEQKRLTRAQMLFDLAQTGLAFAAPMEGERPGLSAAERLALAARTTQLPERIGQRAQSLLEKKQAQKQRDQAIQLSALTAAETKLEAEKGRESALKIEELRQTNKKEATVKGIPVSIFNKFSDVEKEKILGIKPITERTIKGIPESIFNTLSDDDKKKVLGTKPITERLIKNIPESIFNTFSEEDKKKILVPDIKEETVKGIPKSIYDKLPDEEKKRIILPEESDVKGIPKSIFDELSDEDKKRVLLPTGDKIKDIPRDIYDNLSENDKEKVLGISSNILDYKLPLTRMFSKFLTEEGENKGLDLAIKYSLNQTGAEMDNVINFVIDNFTKDVLNTVTNETVPGGILPTEWKEAVQRRVALAQNDDTITLPRAYLGLPTKGQRGLSSSTPALDQALTEAQEGPIGGVTFKSLIDEIDVIKATGTPTAIGQFFNKGSELISFIMKKPFPNVAQAAEVLDGFNINAQLVIMSSVKGKTDKDFRMEIKDKLPTPGKFLQGDETSYNKARNVLAFFNKEIAAIQEILRNPLKTTDVGALRADLIKFQGVARGYANIVKSFERRFKQIEAGGNPQDVDINQFINVNPEG